MGISKFVRIAAMLCAVTILCTFSAFGEPGDPTGNTTADVIFRPGDITISQITAINFGSQDIESTNKSYNATQSPVYVEVNDLRGSGEGWLLSAVASTFKSGVEASLPGAHITLLAGNLGESSANRVPPTVEQSIQLEADGVSSADVAVAGTGQGMGSWRISWTGNAGDNANVSLYVPAGVATTGTHTATITWTLTSAP